MTNRRAALVTGATGFIGSHLVKRLCEAEWDVHIIKRHTSNLSALHGIEDNIKIHIYDGTIQSILTAMNIAEPAIVFHVASFFIAEHKANHINDLVQSNILYPTQLLEAMAINGVRNFINTGTSWQHYHNRSYDPVCLYAATKQAFETVLQYYCETGGIGAITLKLFDTYGPNDTRRKLFNILDEHSRSGNVLLMSGGDQLIDLVYIEDVIDAYLGVTRLFDRGVTRSPMSYSVSSGNPMRLREIVDCYCKSLGKTVKISWGAIPYRRREVMVPWNTGETLPNWAPKVSLQEGLKKMILKD